MAIKFNGSINAYVAIPTLTLSGVCSFSLKFFGNNLNDGLLGHSAGTHKIITLTGPNLFIRPVDGGGSYSASASFNASDWNTLVIKRDGSNKWYKSLNGESFVDISVTASGDSVWSRLGWSSSQNSWTDGLCEFAFWDADLTDTEAAALHRGTRPTWIRRSSLLRYYPLLGTDTSGDETADTHPDYSGNGQDATETGETGSAYYESFPHASVGPWAPLPSWSTIATGGGGGSDVFGATTIAGASTLSGVGSLDLAGATTIAGASTLSGVGSLDLGGATTIAGASTLSGDGSVDLSGAAIIAGASTLSGVGSVDLSGAATIDGVSTVTGSLTLVGGDVFGVATIAGSSTLSGAGSVDLAGTVTIAGVSTLSGVGSLDLGGAATIAGSSFIMGSLTLVGSVNLIASAITNGYAFAVGHIGSPPAEDLINPASLFAALRAGWTWAQAVAVAMPRLYSTVRPIGDPLAVLPFPRQGFEVSRVDGEDITPLAVLPDVTPYELDLSGVLADGGWDLQIVRTDAYGQTSDPLNVMVDVDTTDVTRRPADPISLTATPRSVGLVDLTWQIPNDPDTYSATASFQVAHVSDLSTVIHTKTSNGRYYHTATLGPFTHGSTVALAARSVDGDTVTSRWVAFPLIVADSQGPPAPVPYLVS